LLPTDTFTTKATANYGKAMGGGGFPTDSPTFKISMREYEDIQRSKSNTSLTVIRISFVDLESA
jgi:hypothetical protein